MKTAVLAIAVVVPAAAFGGAFRELKTSAGPQAPVAVPVVAQGVPATPSRPADLVITGRVVSTREAGLPEPISEHAPHWMIATIQPGTGRGVHTIDVYFPASRDVAWASAPKFLVGQYGVWYLKKNRMVGGNYTALGPNDFRPAPDPRAIPSATPAMAPMQELKDFSEKLTGLLSGNSPIVSVSVIEMPAGHPTLVVYYDGRIAPAQAESTILGSLSATQQADFRSYVARDQVLFQASHLREMRRKDD